MILLLVGQISYGTASYYGKKFDHNRTASGRIFHMDSLTAAHNEFPFGTKCRVWNVLNNDSVDVTITDRGGFAKYNRVIDLSKAAFKTICPLKDGVCMVRIEILEIGIWKYKKEEK